MYHPGSVWTKERERLHRRRHLEWKKTTKSALIRASNVSFPPTRERESAMRQLSLFLSV